MYLFIVLQQNDYQQFKYKTVSFIISHFYKSLQPIYTSLNRSILIPSYRPFHGKIVAGRKLE